MQKLKLTLTKIPEDKVFKGEKGDYIDLVLHENKNGPDQYGNDGFIAIDTTKEERDAGVKGAIVGNWRHIGGAAGVAGGTKAYKRKGAAPTTPTPAPKPSGYAAKPRPADPDLDAPEDDDVPF